MKWNKEVNKVVIECFYRSRPFNEEGKPIRGYIQRMFGEWKDKGMFDLLSSVCVIKQGQLEEWVVVKIGVRTD